MEEVHLLLLLYRGETANEGNERRTFMIHDRTRLQRRPTRSSFFLSVVNFSVTILLLLTSHISHLYISCFHPTFRLCFRCAANIMASGSSSNNKLISATAKHTDAEGYEMPWYIRS